MFTFFIIIFLLMSPSLLLEGLARGDSMLAMFGFFGILVDIMLILTCKSSNNNLTSPKQQPRKRKPRTIDEIANEYGTIDFD